MSLNFILNERGINDKDINSNARGRLMPIARGSNKGMLAERSQHDVALLKQALAKDKEQLQTYQKILSEMKSVRKPGTLFLPLPYLSLSSRQLH